MYDRSEGMSPTQKATLSGASSGALLGGASALFDRSVKNWRGALISALLGGTAGGAMAGGSTYVGDKLLGMPPSEDETSPYTKRGALGGLVGGGLAGAGLGAAAASGVFKTPDVVPPLIRKGIDALQKGALKKRLMRGAGLGGAALGLTSAYLGADEGMQLDFLERQMADQRRKQFMVDMMGGG